VSRDVARTAVLDQLERVLASPGFVRNKRLSAFLRFVVDRKLQGHDHELKETVIGVEVFGRTPDYEPRTDPVVRMEAAKLRSRIAEYYANAGVLDPIRIEIPKGGYVPQWETRLPHRRAGWLKPAVIVAAGVCVAITSFVLWRLRTTPNSAMVAVLPFEDLENDPTQRYFSQGVTEDIIAQLGQSGSSAFGVIAGPSVWRYRESQPAPRKLAEDLGVSYVVTGSVQRDKSSLRITAMLTRTQDEVQVWAKSFDGPAESAFALQRDVSLSIARAVASEFSLADPGNAKSTLQIDAETWDLYLHGRFYWNQRTEVSLKQAIDYFNQALARAPNYSPALAGLADSYSALVYGCYMAPAEGFPLARAALRRAHERDSESAEVFASEGYLNLYFDWDFKTARRNLEHAISLNQNYAPAHHWLGVLLTATKDFSEAGRSLQRARRLDPASLPILTDLGFHLHYSGRNAEAQEALRRVFQRDPNFPLAHFWMGRVLHAQGDCSNSLREFQGIASGSLRDWQPLIAGRGFVEGACNEPAAAWQDLERLDTLAQTRFVTSYGKALVFAGLRNKEDAFYWLRKAFEERSHWLVWLRLDPRFHLLRSDSRFQEMERRVFPDA
jgi:TolB-like protein/Tfp pilus assembly protein PilF